VVSQAAPQVYTRAAAPQISTVQTNVQPVKAQIPFAFFLLSSARRRGRGHAAVRRRLTAALAARPTAPPASENFFAPS
jgi:hypothetical protein